LLELDEYLGLRQIHNCYTAHPFGVDVRIILKWIVKKYGVDWIKLAQGRGQLRDFVNVVTNLRVPKKWEFS
jgi:hypothetical protein